MTTVRARLITGAPSVGYCTRDDHKCATAGEGPCNGYPNLRTSEIPPSEDSPPKDEPPARCQACGLLPADQVYAKDDAVYVVTTAPGPNVEFMEMETADGHGVYVPMEPYTKNLWRIGPLYRRAASPVQAADLGEAAYEAHRASVPGGSAALNWGRLSMPLRRAWSVTALAVLERASRAR
jgi:hypothetical protein